MGSVGKRDKTQDPAWPATGDPQEVYDIEAAKGGTLLNRWRGGVVARDRPLTFGEES